MSKTKERLKMIRMYKEETGKTDIDHHDVAIWAVGRGWRLPTPKTAVELLAKELSAAARTQTRLDVESGLPYRANHAYTVIEAGKVKTRWIDIDEKAPRHKMQKSLKIRRDQMVADGLQLTLDAQHWNRVNPKEEPIQPEMDFRFDIELELNAPREEQKAS